MGNRSSCCGADEDGVRCCCLGPRRHNMKSGKMVPADLHSSGAQGNVKPQNRGPVQSRPTTLQTQSSSASSSAAQRQGTGAKFSEFSLHGVQKTSPVEQSDGASDIPGENTVQRRFVLENVSALFNKYKDEDSDEILAEGMAKFCSDLDVDPLEFVVLALAWKFKTATMCKFTREEFTNGCIALQADSLASLKGTFPTLEQEAVINFKDIYKFAFQFGLDSEQGQRSLPPDVAVGMWKVVFSKNPPTMLKDWIEFLEESKVRGISRDTWNMFLHFTENVGSDLSNYDDNEAWPSLFDDFVEYFRTNIDRSSDQNCEEETTSVAVELPEHEELMQMKTSPVKDPPKNEEDLAENAFLPIPGSIPSKEETDTSYFVGEVSTSKNSFSECPSTAEEQTSEFDSEPIRCETLHSSHLP